MMDKEYILRVIVKDLFFFFLTWAHSSGQKESIFNKQYGDWC